MAGRKTNIADQIQRQQVAYEAHASGYNLADIAKKFGVSQRTITRDITAFGKQYRERIKKKSAEDMFAELFFRSDQRRRGLLSIARDKRSSPMHKILAYRNLREEDMQAVKTAQIMGILPNVADPQFFFQQNNTTVENKSVFQTILAIKHGELKADEQLIKEAEAKLCSPLQQ